MPARTSVADDEEVALALVDVHRLGDVLEPGVREPLQVGGALGPPLGVGEPRAEGAALDDEAAVGGEDHVRQAGLGVDELHLVAEVEVGLAERSHWRDGQVAVDAPGRRPSTG